MLRYGKQRSPSIEKKQQLIAACFNDSWSFPALST